MKDYEIKKWFKVLAWLTFTLIVSLFLIINIIPFIFLNWGLLIITILIDSIIVPMIYLLFIGLKN